MPDEPESEVEELPEVIDSPTPTEHNPSRHPEVFYMSREQYDRICERLDELEKTDEMIKAKVEEQEDDEKPTKKPWTHRGF